MSQEGGRRKDVAAERNSSLKIVGEISVREGSASEAFLNYFAPYKLAIENEGTPNERTMWDPGIKTLVRSSKYEPLKAGMIRVYELQEDMRGDGILAALPAAPQVSLADIAHLLERRTRGEPIPLDTGGRANLFVIGTGRSRMIVHAFLNQHKGGWRFELMPLLLKARWLKGPRVFARTQN